MSGAWPITISAATKTTYLWPNCNCSPSGVGCTGQHATPYPTRATDLADEFAALLARAEAAVAAEREACARVAEGGRFLHDDAPDARFGKACAAAIRARSKTGNNK